MKTKNIPFSMFKSLLLLLAIWSFPFNVRSQLLPFMEFGVYRTEADYEQGRAEILGERDGTGETTFRYLDENGKKRKLKVSECGCWAIKYGKNKYLVHEGNAYLMLFIGKISLYATGPLYIDWTEDGNYEVTAYMGNGGKKIYFHPGTRGVPERLTSRKQLDEYMQDYPEALARLDDGSGALFTTWLKSVLDAVFLYNKHHGQEVMP